MRAGPRMHDIRRYTRRRKDRGERRVSNCAGAGMRDSIHLCIPENAARIFLGSLKMKNIDMTDTRLLITYWKEYLIGTIITMGCYLGMKFVLEN